MKNLKCHLLATATILLALQGRSQNVGINDDGQLPNSNAILDVRSATKGLLFPRMSSTSRMAIPNTKGMVVYDTTTNSLWFNTGNSWQTVSAGGVRIDSARGNTAAGSLANGAVTVIEGQVPFTTPSDGRFKYQVREDVKGLDFIMQLRPVTYRFDVRRFDDQQIRHEDSRQPAAVSNAMQAAYNEASAIRRSGFIAQEVEKAASTTGYDFSGIIRPKTDEDHYSLSYESFVVPLVKAVQEQQWMIEELRKEIAILKNEKTK